MSAGSSQNGGTAKGIQSGTVERVREDGFRLNTGSRSLNVDAWDVFDDKTPRHASVGNLVQVSGEISEGEVDAASVTGGGLGR